MSARALHLVIDARPRGRRGLLAAEVVLGKSVLDHLLDVAHELAPSAEPVVVHAREEEQEPADASWRADSMARACSSSAGRRVPMRSSADRSLLRRRAAASAGCGGPIAGIGRSLAARPARNARNADEELTRRRSYQPLGKYWAFPLAERPGRAASARPRSGPMR